MDDLMTSINSANKAGNGDNNSQQSTASQGSSQSSSYGQQSNTGYNNSQYGYGQQSSNTTTGYGSPQSSSYGQQSNTGYNNSQYGYGQQSSNTTTGYGSSQSSGYGQQSNTGYNNSQYGYGSSDTAYTYNDFGEEQSKLLPIIKGVLGAVIGSVPGVLLIIFLANLGFIASLCGALMAVGAFFGYNLMTKKSGLSTGTGMLICGVVMLIGIYVAVRISWTMEMATSMRLAMNMIMNALGESPTKSELTVLYQEVYGVTSPTFGQCWEHFSDLLDNFDLRGDFIGSLFENIAFAALGCFGTFMKFGNGKI